MNAQEKWTRAAVPRRSNDADRDDAEQLAWLQFLERGPEGIRNPEAYRARCAARNLARRTSREGPLEGEPGDGTPETCEVAARAFASEEVRLVLAELPPRLRRVWEAVYEEGRSYRETAEREGCCAATVHTQVRKLQEWVLKALLERRRRFAGPKPAVGGLRADLDVAFSGLDARGDPPIAACG